VSVTIEKTAYRGWQNCYRIFNGQIELIVTSDVGPRVIRCGFSGGQNLFKNYDHEMGGTNEADWKIRGGHRVWVAPERKSYTYELDNHPVAIDLHPDGLTATARVNPQTGLQQSLTLHMSPERNEVIATSRVRNCTRFPVQYAPWGPTVMAPGGLGITGFPPRGTHAENVEPTNPFVMWAYSDFTDARWKFTSKYVTLRQDVNCAGPQKLGIFNPLTFGAYLLNGELFLKQFRPDVSKQYADMGCSYQSFTNQDMLELETMGALEYAAPGEALEFTETWSLHRPVKLDEITDASLDALLLPLLK
jgi:hypothetical protein